MLWKVSFRSAPLNGVVAYWESQTTCQNAEMADVTEMGRSENTHDHLINENPKGPPVHRRCMAGSLNDFWGNVFCGVLRSERDNAAAQLPYPLYRRRSLYGSRRCMTAYRLMVSGNWLSVQEVAQVTGRRTPFSSWWIVAGRPPETPDCFARSKSDNMICPDWCKRMSVQGS